MILRKIILLKWLLIPIILCVRLIIIQTERIIFSVILYYVLCFSENNKPYKINTLTGFKVRMNN